MTVIWMDSLLLLNFTADFLLLRLTGRAAGESCSPLRCAAGAAVGALYAGAVFLPGAQWLAHPVCRICAAAGTVTAAFGKSRRLLRLGLIFFALSALLGGVVLAVSLAAGGMYIGRAAVTDAFDLKLLLILLAAGYKLGTLLLRSRVPAGQPVEVTVELDGRQARLRALVDTGNRLTDPVTLEPVTVVYAGALGGLLPPGADAADPVGSLRRLKTARWRLLPYAAVGVDSALLLAVRCDGVVRGDGVPAGRLVALSPTPVAGDGDYEALLGG